MSWLEKWSWKPETPARVPAGARISAGKSGKVLTSLPKAAEVLVSCPPTTCMPSPESPQKRMTADSSCSEGLSFGCGGSLLSSTEVGEAMTNNLLKMNKRPVALLGWRESAGTEQGEKESADRGGPYFCSWRPSMPVCHIIVRDSQTLNR